MAVTFQTVINNARVPLNDDAKVRYTDATLLAYANDGINYVLTIRPDLFIGQYSTFSTDGGYALTDNIPIDTRYTAALQDYITGRAEVVDSEFVDSGRISVLLNLFKERLLA